MYDWAAAFCRTQVRSVDHHDLLKVAALQGGRAWLQGRTTTLEDRATRRRCDLGIPIHIPCIEDKMRRTPVKHKVTDWLLHENNSQE